jgi:Mor family transcriptional regulator
MSAQQGQYSEAVLVDLVTIVEQALVSRGIDRDSAHKASFDAAEQLRDRWGGQMLYFPKGSRFDMSQRDMAIWNAFSGHNHNELASKYDVCVDRVYKIVKYMRAMQSHLRQADIFDDSAGKG